MVDELAMKAVASGDIDKAAVLYERYKRPMLAYFYRNLAQKSQAEDLMQQVFFRMINYRKSYGDGYAFKAWLYRIAHNVLQDFLRKNGTPNASLESAPEVIEESNYYSEEQEEILKKALQRLSPEYKDVILMSRYEELKYEEIAQVLNITVALVKVRVHRGLKVLREIYLEMESR